MKRFLGLSAALAAVAIAPQFANAHFRLLAPDSAIQESQLGDPQKMAPCGGNSEKAKGGANPGTPTNMVTKVTGGQKLHIKVEETVYHPGHYRIALAVNSRTELPADPEAVLQDSPKGPQSVSAPIMNPVKPPVLVDGLWAHATRAQTPIPWETDVEMPNINCAKCTLQIIQFMAEHGRNVDGDFSYHHCADLQITADKSKPVDTRWPGQK
jgi:hypothetical protein